ncbi:citrate lyase acyl carrier protein [Brachyspira hyodysenteriae]|uniref:citrate lyase acyl carrier protein n=1 Tax=Brachyspira hyodysenteriae TaxID=159 RepID=UPI001182AE82|nr:citrate lyase acyl carrier protein [Brachyspira hyodysenteriae]MBT8719581.1 citrate lyase acyl carrier protein [Brachyspira hyodysenteriae]MBT8729820.1 citrate lyase acyl carrier protein [Brachyspira hyodysenteriae]MBT8731989.1 citrate lyase acyl carrier protein [Brachyspira hyodysenteriae]MBT8734657.1 citrate lyase acyl carrier protein [Brachyspira hyodysenteriae]MBT8737651.1 citrate lyase acyl carrier protein [Brachyspira hyodysenteriae]
MATKKISDDAIINATITNSGGIVININSTVKHMFFNNIKKAVEEVVNETDIKNIVIDVDDYGALDFCIRARTRMAIRRAIKSLEAVK